MAFIVVVAHRKGKTAPLVKFSEDPDLEKEECVRLLDRYTPEHMKYNKTTQKLFVRYMYIHLHIFMSTNYIVIYMCMYMYIHVHVSHIKSWYFCCTLPASLCTCSYYFDLHTFFNIYYSLAI